MSDRLNSANLIDLPLHLILEILTSGCKLGGMDLVCLELSNTVFRKSSHELVSKKSKSLVDFAAFQICELHPFYVGLSHRGQDELVVRCGGNWKRVLRFLQSVEQSSDVIETTSGNVRFFIAFLTRR